MEETWESGDSPGECHYFDGKRPVMTQKDGRSFNNVGVDITAELETESSNESSPPPAEPWDGKRYRKLGHLGDGTQASVGKYFDLESGRVCAIKPYNYTDDLRSNIVREIAIMATLSNDPDSSLYMARLVRWHERPETREIWLVMYPVAKEGSLCDKLIRQFESPDFEDLIGQHFPEEALRNLAHGLAIIHTHSVRHKDIGAQNVLIHDRRAIYTDFGISLYFDRRVSATGESSNDNPTESTLYENTYAAPELLDGLPRSTKSDVFSLGCVIWEILVARSVVVLRKKEYIAETGFGGQWGFDRGDGYAKRLRDGLLGRAFRRMRSERMMREYTWILDVIERMVKDDPKERISASWAYNLTLGYETCRGREKVFWVNVLEREYD